MTGSLDSKSTKWPNFGMSDSRDWVMLEGHKVLIQIDLQGDGDTYSANFYVVIEMEVPT